MGAIKRAVGTGLGLAVVPFLSVEQELLRGDLAEVKRNDALSDEAQIYAVFKDKDDSGVREIFFDFCRIAPLPANR
jgi:DNA-binding transcriptional LysR family regulator